MYIGRLNTHPMNLVYNVQCRVAAEEGRSFEGGLESFPTSKQKKINGLVDHIVGLICVAFKG